MLNVLNLGAEASLTAQTHGTTALLQDGGAYVLDGNDVVPQGFRVDVVNAANQTVRIDVVNGATLINPGLNIEPLTNGLLATGEATARIVHKGGKVFVLLFNSGEAGFQNSN